MTQGVQAYAQNMPQSPMEGNHPIYPLPQPSMMQFPMMQGFQSPFSMNPINQQQLSLLMMSTCARMMAITQLMNMQNRYQPYQPNQYSGIFIVKYYNSHNLSLMLIIFQFTLQP